MNTTRSLRSMIIGIPALLLMSCGTSRTGVNSLDLLTTSASNSGAAAKPVNLDYPLQTRFLAVNGLLPVSGPGSACLASGFRPSTAIICYNQGENTEIVYRHYDTDAKLKDLIEIQKALQALEVDVISLLQTEALAADENSLQPQAQAARTKLAQDIATSSRSIALKANRKNIFLFRWQNENAAGGTGTVGSIFDAEGSANSAQGGVVIVGGLVLSQLLIGKKDYPEELAGYSKSAKIATLTMGAKHLVYFTEASLSAAISGSLEGSVKEFSEKISPEAKVALAAYAAIGRAQENQGAFSATRLRTASLSDYPKEGLQEQIFYSTFTDVETLLETLNEKASD